jgi:hypothetical protein
VLLFELSNIEPFSVQHLFLVRPKFLVNWQHLSLSA